MVDSIDKVGQFLGPLNSQHDTVSLLEHFKLLSWGRLTP